jgi:hypothetical protein
MPLLGVVAYENGLAQRDDGTDRALTLERAFGFGLELF